MKWTLGEDYKNLMREVDDLEDEVRHTWAMLKYPLRRHGGSRVYGSENEDFMGEGIAKAIDMEEELNNKIEQLKSLRLKIETTIEALPCEQRRLMRLRYIRCFTWQQIAQRLYCDESTCRRLHRVIVRCINETNSR